MKTIIMKETPNVFALILLFISHSVLADDGALYDPTVKDDEALVRVLNLTNDTVTTTLLPVNKEIKNVSSFDFSHYIRVKRGKVEMNINGKDSMLVKEINVRSGAYYTIALKVGGELSVIQDPIIKKKGKAMLALYNFTHKETLDLKTSNGKINIIKNVSKGKSGYREINAVSLNMAIFDGATRIKATEQQQLMKDRILNIAIIETNNQFAIKIIESNVNTRI